MKAWHGGHGGLANQLRLASRPWQGHEIMQAQRHTAGIAAGVVPRARLGVLNHETPPVPVGKPKSTYA